MNKLDGKCIVDRDKLRMIFNALESIHHEEEKGGYPLHPEMRAFMEHFRIALAQDSTGFVATVAEPTREMAYAGRNARLNTYIPPIMDASVGDNISFRAMLEASPPLPTGEKQ